jgi:hypothetical protein
MRRAGLLFLVFLLPPLAAAAPADDEDDWRFIGGALALVQQIVHLAANSPDPQAAQKGVEAMLSGENAEANRLASGLLNEMLLDVPPEYHGTFAAISRDLLALARRERARGAAALPGESARDDALRARKELHAMGLRYWDEQQFLEAVKRGDRLAVELYLAAGGLEVKNPPPAR